MSKRKLDEFISNDRSDRDGDDAGLSPLVKRQRHHLRALIADGSTQIFHALRFARGFERQKLGRRQKSAAKKGGKKKKKQQQQRQDNGGSGSGDENVEDGGDDGNDDNDDDGDARRLEAEVSELKKLQLADLADVYLCKQLARTKHIAGHQALPRSVARRAAAPVPKTQAYVNVTSRLFKSNPVTKAMERVMAEITSSLGLREEEVKAKKKRMRKADYEAANSNRATTDVAEKVDTTTKEDPVHGESKLDRSLGRDLAENEINGVHDDPMLNGGPVSPRRSVRGLDSGDEKGQKDFEGDNYDNHEFRQYDARVASGSDSEGGSSEDADFLANLRSRGRNTQDVDMASISDSGGSSRGQSPPLRRTAARTAIDSTRSAFLPSLNTGYISGSESDASDASALAPPRKNRMGQRARREMWERKYGNKANHLQLDGRSMKDRDRGWDLRRGAQDYDRGGYRRRRGGRGDFSGRPGPRNYDRAEKPAIEREKKEKVPQKTPTYGKEHPSWIAKQAAKEKLEAAGKPAGKKITFD